MLWITGVQDNHTFYMQTSARFSISLQKHPNIPKISGQFFPFKNYYCKHTACRVELGF